MSKWRRSAHRVDFEEFFFLEERAFYRLNQRPMFQRAAKLVKRAGE